MVRRDTDRRAFVGCLLRPAALVILAALASGCASIAAGPPRLYSIQEETDNIKDGLKSFKSLSTAEFARANEATRMQYRNDWIAGRMYAIDIQYTAYEAALTRERQGIGFGAAASTVGLTTASGLVSSVATKDLLTGIAGFITGARAAYENDILLAHSVQWIQTQMRARRADVATRLLRGMKASTIDYPLAAALSDLEAYYRAGTFTGGIIATTETLGTDVRFSEQAKDETLEVTFRSSNALDALTACVNTRSGAKAALQQFVPPPRPANVNLLLTGQGDVEGVLARARDAGIC